MNEYRGITKNDKEIKINGNATKIIIDLIVIVDAVYNAFVESGNQKELAKKLILEAVQMGLKSPEEISEEISKTS